MTMQPSGEMDQAGKNGDEKPWTFLTNHTRVLLVIAENPNTRLRDIAGTIGITERATQRIVADLEEAEYLSHEKVGRRNIYQIEPGKPLRHELEQDSQIRNLLDVLRPNRPEE
jgi:DNA-binding MarR family transcriptional regulator